MEKRFGFIGLEPGVTVRHMWVLLYASFVSIGLATFDAFGMPYVLSENVGVAIEEQGAVVGRLNVYTEILLLMVFTPTWQRPLPGGLGTRMRTEVLSTLILLVMEELVLRTGGYLTKIYPLSHLQATLMGMRPVATQDG